MTIEATCTEDTINSHVAYGAPVGYAPVVVVTDDARTRQVRRADKSSRNRMRELRARVKEAKRIGRRGRHDQVRFYQVPLLDSTVDKLAVDLKVEKADDRPITTREWRKLIGLVAAQAVKLGIDKKK